MTSPVKSGNGAWSLSALPEMTTFDPILAWALLATSLSGVSWSTISNVSGSRRWSSTMRWRTLESTAGSSCWPSISIRKNVATGASGIAQGSRAES